MRICIDGLIGSGKTTHLSNLEKTYIVYREKVDDWVREGWLSHFYKDTKRYGLGFQLRVLLSNLEVPNPESEILLIERSPFTSYNVFAKLMHSMGNMEEIELDLNRMYYERIGWNPDAIIYLNCPVECAYNRIVTRQREEVPMDYLKKLSDFYDSALSETKIPVHYVDAGHDDIAKITSDIEKICSMFHDP